MPVGGTLSAPIVWPPAPDNAAKPSAPDPVGPNGTLVVGAVPTPTKNYIETATDGAQNNRRIVHQGGPAVAPPNEDEGPTADRDAGARSTPDSDGTKVPSPGVGALPVADGASLPLVRNRPSTEDILSAIWKPAGTDLEKRVLHGWQAMASLVPEQHRRLQDKYLAALTRLAPRPMAASQFAYLRNLRNDIAHPSASRPVTISHLTAATAFIVSFVESIQPETLEDLRRQGVAGRQAEELGPTGS